MKIIVGLGNPGRKYQGTRHNVGFEVVEELARRHGSQAAKNRFQAEVLEARLGGEKVLLVEPQTFMNLSGRSVKAVVDYYNLEPEDLLVVCDDLNLPLAKIRTRAKGSAGGQNGLADVIRVLGTEAFSRLRVGIGQPPEQWDAADWVLGKFTSDERQEIDLAIRTAADAVEVWAAEGIEATMNRFN